MALIVAVLYFGLIELLLYDASRELGEARRFRARIIALTLAENGAELAAQNLVTVPPQAPVTIADWQGTMSGKVAKSAGGFTIDGTGDVTGIVKVHATVIVQGRVDDEKKTIKIDYTFHSQ
ncbi:MAG: hypothetical protein M3P06_03350 [Acidobacteriota bacterium]|nr:hypothetical protein [Acidobacteriota bacterium]